jgi:hypothetical protein
VAEKPRAASVWRGLRGDQERLPNGLWFRLRRVTWKSTPSNQGCLLLVGPLLRRGSFTPVPLRGPAPNGHPCPDGALARIHAARPTARRLRSACTQVAIGVVWNSCARRSRSRSRASRLKPVLQSRRFHRCTRCFVGLALAGKRPAQAPKFLLTVPLVVGASLLANAVSQTPDIRWMYRPLREQAHSHKSLATDLPLSCP